MLLEQASPRQADAVIILCGINDVKTCFLQGKIFFRENFENELENVIKEIKAVVGGATLGSSCCRESIAHRAFVSESTSRGYFETQRLLGRSKRKSG